MLETETYVIGKTANVAQGAGGKKTCKVRRQTLLHLFFLLISQSGRIPPKSPEVREERAPSNDSLRSTQLP